MAFKKKKICRRGDALDSLLEARGVGRRRGVEQGFQLPLLRLERGGGVVPVVVEARALGAAPTFDTNLRGN